MVPESGKVTPVGIRPPVNDDPDVPMPADPMRRTWPSSIPQPTWYPASSVPPLSVVEPSPDTVPVNVPPTRYSRDETAVVSGATGSWVSSLATTESTQPSGVVTTPGGADATTPVSGGGTTLTGGSALAS